MNLGKDVKILIDGIEINLDYVTDGDIEIKCGDWKPIHRVNADARILRTDACTLDGDTRVGYLSWY